jgi:iron complex outermembrane receptor protein
MKCIVQACMLMGLLLPAFLPALAQSGQVAGSVSDPHNRLVAGAKVKLTNLETKKSVATSTGNQGTYSFSALAAGHYELQVEAKGFRTESKSDVEVANTLVTQDFALKLQTRQETVQVKPSSLIGQDENAPGTKDYIITHSTTGSKAELPNNWVAQDVVVVSPKLIEDLNLRSVVGATETVAGVSNSYPAYFALDEEASAIIRGFAVSTTLRNGLWDPMSSGNIGWMGDVDRVEVVKGPAGLEYGSYTGGIGGVINVITKKPFNVRRYVLKTNTDSYGSWGVSADLSQPLSPNKKWLARANLNIGDTQIFASRADREERDGSLIVQGLITSKDALTMEYSRRWMLDHPYSGLPGYAPQGTSLASMGTFDLGLDVYNPVSHWTYNTHNARAVYEHQFSQNWELRSTGQVVRTGRVTRAYTATPSWNWNASTKAYTPLYTQSNTSYIDIHMGPVQTWDTDTMIEGNFSTWRVKHVLVAGYRFAREGYDMNKNTDTFTGPSSFTDPYHPTWRTVTSATRTTFGLYWQHQHDAYINVVAAITSRLRLTAGVNYISAFETYTRSGPSPAKETGSGYSDSSQAWRVGGLYDLFTGTTLFADYATTFLPNAPNTTTTGVIQTFEPVTGDQVEAGVKVSINNRVNLTAALYQITMNNKVELDPTASDGSEVAIGTEGSRGAELDGTYKLGHGWNLLTSYAFTDVRIRKDKIYLIGSSEPNVPKESLRVWGSYDFSAGTLRGLELGGGVSAESQRTTNIVKASSPSLVARMPAYGIVNAFAAYSFAKRYKAMVNAGNIFNQRYWDSSGGNANLMPAASTGSYSWLYPGEPANVTIRLQASF